MTNEFRSKNETFDFSALGLCPVPVGGEGAQRSFAMALATAAVLAGMLCFFLFYVG